MRIDFTDLESFRDEFEERKLKKIYGMTKIKFGKLEDNTDAYEMETMLQGLDGNMILSYYNKETKVLTKEVNQEKLEKEFQDKVESHFRESTIRWGVISEQ